MRSGLIESELAEGRVVRSFQDAIKALSYYLVYPSGRPMSASLEAFRDWLLEEVAIYEVGLADAAR